MRRLAGGVTIVTTRLGEVRAGLTAAAVCSLTAEPPRLLACVHREADAHDLILESRVFAVNVLAPVHRELADHFGGRDDSHGPARFALGRWRSGAGGVPILADAAASF
jgi:flavin reductase (DIM6/NTAB) family NADH-FMN oxidoreductase RutF